MADILTQEEIDELLSAICDDQVITKPDYGSPEFEKLLYNYNNIFSDNAVPSFFYNDEGTPEAIMKKFDNISEELKKYEAYKNTFNEFYKKAKEIADNQPEIFI